MVGQVPSLMMLLAAVLGLVIGPLADHHGYRITLVVGMLTVAISALGTALATTFVPVLLAGLVGAVGRAAVVPTAQAAVGRCFSDEDRRRRAISWVATGYTAAPLLGIPLLTMVAAFAHWRASFLVAGGLAVATALLLRWSLAADGARSGRSPRLRELVAAYGPLRHHRPSVALILASLLANVGTWATFTFLGAYLVQRHAFGTPEVGWAYLAVGIGTVYGTRLVGGRLGGRLRPLVIACRVVGGLAICAALTLPVPALAAVALLALGAMAHTATSAGTAALLVAESPAGRATTMTVNSAGQSVGWAVGGAVGGLALAVGDYPTVGLASLAWLLAAAIVVLWSRPREVTASDPVPA